MAQAEASIPAEFTGLFEQKSFAHFATVMPDGTPQVTPVWVDHDGDDVLVNTARGRQKERNVTRNPRVGVSVLDPEDPYRYVSIRGEVVEVTEDGAVDHIDTLAQRYMGVEEYPHHGEEGGPRVIIRIRPHRVITSG
ncbi:MAG: PPOX class F420-dependent oxidoreductase [Halobacteriaceae archaeon]